MKKKVKFIVGLEYESLDDSPICEEAMKDNLKDAIENERINGALTPDDISAEKLKVTILAAADSE
tara:strand:+ start:474 stop:668 length:195 start_codon:yes stop_codon:yes gene_type:complete